MSDVELLYHCSAKLFTYWWPLLLVAMGYCVYESQVLTPRWKKAKIKKDNDFR